MSGSGGNCGSSSGGGSSGKDKQATPFNLFPFEVLLVYCVVIALTSSLYYNWPAVERILVDARVFGNLCTREQIHAAVEGMFVCDRQRKEIGNLALYIFYSEFVAFSIGGVLADLVGVYLVLILGFIFGFLSFIILYMCYLDNPMIKLAFCFWGMFGGFVFITSIHFPKMFPSAKSLADGMIIFFDNMSGLMPLIMYSLMKKFKLKYNEVFGSYLIWGLFPAFALTLLFIPVKIVNQNNSPGGGGGNNNNAKYWPIDTGIFSCLPDELKKHQLWTNLCVYSISLTCCIFYKKMFSTYFLRNQKLVRLFPIFLLFVFLPTPFISVLNQFIGVNMTSSLLYVLTIFAFICCLYPTRQYGFLSMVLFTISTSAAEQQTMTYISENNQKNESTLLGISYAVDLIIGLMLQPIFHRIYYKCSPRMTVYFIVILFIILIAYSIYCHIKSCSNGQANTSQGSKTPGWRILYILLWFLPFLILCLVLKFKAQIDKGSENRSNWISQICTCANYINQKRVTMPIVFYSFSLFYIYEVFFILFSIYKVAGNLTFLPNKLGWFVYFLYCLLIISQFVSSVTFCFNDKKHMNIVGLLALLFLYKMILYVCYIKGIDKQWSFHLFFGFLISYGFLLFVLIYMLSYYNFLIGFVERCYKSSLIHWSTVTSAFISFRLIQHILSRYRYHYYIMFGLSCFFFTLLTIVLSLYLPYEMNIGFSFRSCNLPIPNFKSFNSISVSDKKFYCRVVSVALTICNMAVIINMSAAGYHGLLFLFLLVIHLLIHLSNFGLMHLCDEILTKCEESDQNGAFVYIRLSLTGASLFLFLLLFIIRIFVSNNNFNNNKIIGFIIFVNFVVLCLSSNLTFMEIQKQLQCCCCTQEGEECCKCICCTGKKENECCEPSCKTCPCCSGTNGTCEGCCQKQTKCSCNNGQDCKNCCCKCLKKVQGTNNSERYFCFYKKDICKVNELYPSFIIGTVLGWLMFVAYLKVSKGRIEECLFQ